MQESKGEGEDRCITVFRPLESTPAEELTEEEEKEEAHEDEKVPESCCVNFH